MGRVIAVTLLAVMVGCSARGATRAELQVLAVEPQAVPPDVPEVAVLFRATRTGPVRVESEDAPGHETVLVPEGATYAAGSLGSLRIAREGMVDGPHLVSVVLRPGDGTPEVEDQAVFYIGHDPEPEQDAGVEPDASVPEPDGGAPSCSEQCAGEGDHEVCGVDGETYDNACLAGCVGGGVASDGPCPGEFDCFEECVDESPILVCGEDGQTYLNDCHLECAGVEKDHEGPCFAGF